MLTYYKVSRGGNPLNISRYEVVYPCHLRDFTLPFLHDLHATGRLFQPTHIETSSQKGLEAFSHILKPSVELPLCGSGDPLHFFSDHYLHVYVHIIGLNIKPKTPQHQWLLSTLVPFFSYRILDAPRIRTRLVEVCWIPMIVVMESGHLATTLFPLSRVTLLQDWTTGLKRL